MNEIMQSGAKAAPDIQAVKMVVDALTERPYRPLELLKKLERPDVSESRLKDALAVLLDQHRLELTPDRYIKLRDIQPAAAQ